MGWKWLKIKIIIIIINVCYYVGAYTDICCRTTLQCRSHAITVSLYTRQQVRWWGRACQSTGNDDLSRTALLSSRRKTVSGALRREGGTEFQALAAASGNARSPSDEWWWELTCWQTGCWCKNAENLHSNKVKSRVYDVNMSLFVYLSFMERTYNSKTAGCSKFKFSTYFLHCTCNLGVISKSTAHSLRSSTLTKTFGRTIFKPEVVLLQ